MTHHLVILKTTFLRSILLGCKTTECRLSRYRRAPFGLVSVGDTLWLKQSGGPVRATAVVRDVEFVHPLGQQNLEALYRRYGGSLQVDQRFFAAGTKARFATLLHLRQVRTIKPLKISKQNRHAWVILPGPLTQQRQQHQRTTA